MTKEAEGVGGDYGRYEREADGMTTGDLSQSSAKEQGAQAVTEAEVSVAISLRRNAMQCCGRSQRSS